jgi:iron complex outermembrane receptor protein
MKNAKYFFVLLVFAGLVFPLAAQTIDTIIQIQGVEVFGTTNESTEKVALDPNNRSQQDAGKLLMEVNNVGLIKKGNYAYDPVIRGFKYNQLHLLANGFVQTSSACPNRMDAPSSQISMNNLESVEIIKGPYSVKYGMNTGGVVNYISQGSKATDKFTMNGNLGFFYQTNGNSKDGQGMLSISDKKYYLQVSGGMKDFGNYKSGDGIEILSKFKHSDYGVKGAWFINAHHQVILDWRQAKAEDALFAGLPMDSDFDKSKTGSLHYSYKNEKTRLTNVDIKAYGNFIDHQMSNRNRPAWVNSQAISKLQSQTFGARGEFNFKLSEKQPLLLGIDYKKVAKQGDRERLVFLNECTGMVVDPAKLFTDALWQNSYQTDLGVFLESRREFGKLMASAGIRADFVNSEAKEPSADFKALYANLGKRSEMAVMGNIQLKYMISKPASIHLKVGYGQRAADITERYINHMQVGADAYEYVGNPDLKMEKNLQTDLSFHFIKEKFQFEATLFYAKIKDYIQASLDTTLPKKFMACMPPAHAKRFGNIDDARLYGFETYANLLIWKGLGVNASWTYTLGDNITDDEPLAEIPPMEIRAGLGYKATKWQAQFKSRFVGEQTRISTSFNESASTAFVLMDFNARYTIIKGLNLSLNVDNMFDVNYVEHLSRAYKSQADSSLYWEPGRNFILGLTYKF